MPNAQVSKAAAQSAKLQAMRDLATLPGLMGLGLTHAQGGYALKVNLRTALPQGAVPIQVQGGPVVVEVVGTVQRG